MDTVPSLSTFYIGLDMENVRLRYDSTIVLEMPFSNRSVTEHRAMIFDAAARRCTSFALSAPPLPDKCSYYDFPQSSRACRGSKMHAAGRGPFLASQF
mmetsp:Transcript_84397/g.152236  ORF Transcript_84397/g.152236 Transcript_84397/m.152236 type:complete len:98 (+) Transcript_84397:95-388(+)